MKVCVIGAGPAGLTTIKQLIDEDHEVTCFERSSGIGGIWYRDDDDASEMKVFDSLILTISMKLMGFSDFMVGGDRVFYTHVQYLEYLNAYASRYGLQNHISLNSKVTKVRKIPGTAAEGGEWMVSVFSCGRLVEHRFDAVATCIGPFQKPNLKVNRLQDFSGEVIHSSQYRNADSQSYQNKRVLVVGLAESGADLLREVSDVASECTLSIRSYSWLIPRANSGKYATDSTTLRARTWELFVRSTDVPYPMNAIFGDNRAERIQFAAAARLYGLVSAAAKSAARLFGRTGKDDDVLEKDKNVLGEPMFPLKMDIGTEWNREHLAARAQWNSRSDPRRYIYVKNMSFIPNIVKGKISINDQGIEEIRGKKVTFKNGETREVDTIVLCTGFERDFSILGPELAVRDNNVRNLYKHAFHPEHGGRLAFIGFVRPYTGGIPICAEMQARYFALLCSGKTTLPVDISNRIQKEKAWEEQWSLGSPRHTESIPSQSFFIDSIAKDIGCLMSVSELIRKPRLLVRHWFYPFNQACYRLKGPHAMPEEAMREFLSDKPGPWSGPRQIAILSILSMLPQSIRPMAIQPFRTPAASKGPYFGHEHALNLTRSASGPA